MDTKPYCVHIVIDPRYGKRIRELPINEPAWVIESPVNKPVVVDLWNGQRCQDQTEGITIFNSGSGISSEDCLLAELGTIDLHYGQDSHDPPYSMIRAIGVNWSERIASELQEFGFVFDRNTADGFTAKREI